MSKQIALEIEVLLKEFNVSKDPSVWQTILLKKGKYKDITGNVFHPVPEVSPHEKHLVYQLFVAFDGYSWETKFKFGWIGIEGIVLPLEAPVHYLYGIFTSLPTENTTTSVVTRIDLSGAGCRGSINKIVFDFEFCTYIDLSVNMLTGSEPISFKSLRSLEHFNIASNQLHFTVSQLSLSACSKLIYLNLSYNQIHGEIPESLFESCLHIEYIDLSNNQLSGTLPIFYAHYSLRSLHLAGNSFSGTLPECYSSLTALTELNLADNMIAGGIDVCYTMTSLHKLILNNNALTGILDDCISQLNKLETLYLQYNHITGYLPDAQCTLSNLKYLDISYNDLYQRLPFDIGDLHHLEVLRLTNNNIIGPMPESLSKLVNLKHFHVFTPYPSESTSAPLQFDLERFHHLCGMQSKVGIDSFTCSPLSMYGQPEFNGEQLADEIRWLKAHMRRDDDDS